MEITTFMCPYLLVDFMFWQWTASEHIWIEIYSYIGRKYTGTVTLPKIYNNTFMQNTSKKRTWKEKRKKESCPQEVSWGLSNSETVQTKIFFFQSAFKWLWGPGNISCCQKSRAGALQTKTLHNWLPLVWSFKSQPVLGAVALCYSLYFQHDV